MTKTTRAAAKQNQGNTVMADSNQNNLVSPDKPTNVKGEATPSPGSSSKKRKNDAVYFLYEMKDGTYQTIKGAANAKAYVDSYSSLIDKTKSWKTKQSMTNYIKKWPKQTVPPASVPLLAPPPAEIQTQACQLLEMVEETADCDHFHGYT